MSEEGVNILKLWESSKDEVNNMTSLLENENLNNQFFRRLFVRNVFSLVEIRLFIMREILRIFNRYDDIGLMSAEEKIVLDQTSIHLLKSGKIKTSPKFYDLESTLKFTLITFAKVFNQKNVEFNNESWNKLLIMSKRRNDLTHPKSYELLIITVSELNDTIDAFNWFISISNSMFQEFSKLVESTKI